MSKRRRATSLFLSALAALGALAFSSVPAQAAGQWTINGITLTGTETTVGKLEGSATFLVPSLKLEIACEQGTLKGELKAEGLGQQIMNFSSCKVPNAPSCEVEPIEAGFKLEVVLHAGETWIIYRPPTKGGPFAIIRIYECALPEESELTGAFVSLVNSKESVQQLLSFLTDEATSKLFNVSYAFGVNPAFLDMSTIWELSGKNAGQVWGAI